MSKVESKYTFGAANEDVELAMDTATAEFDDQQYTGPAKAKLRLLPQARVIIAAELQGPWDPAKLLTGEMLGDYDSLHLRQIGISIPGFAVSRKVSKGSITVEWHPRTEPVQVLGGDSTQIAELYFHLFNFRDILGVTRSQQTVGETTHAIEEIDLAGDGWQVHLQSTVNTRSNLKGLRATGGYALTHVGWSKRNDGSTFSGEQAHRLLSILSFFVSFAKGVCCNPVCPLGCDEDGTTIWSQWSSPSISWRVPISWFDEYHSQQLVALFPGFVRCWRNDDWRNALQEVLYWYLNSNDTNRGIDAGIILTQSAIERLSFEYAVQDRRLMETDGFKKLRASDKFRLLFSSLGIPIDIPVSLTGLIALSQQFKWIDAPHTLTEIRNATVHPDRKHRGKFKDAYFEAWNLGLWLLELAILRICDYTGDYNNRLTSRAAGQVETVPWM